MGCSDFERNDTVESAQRSKPCCSILYNAFLRFLIIYSGQQCAKAGIQWAMVVAERWMLRLDSRFRGNDEIMGLCA